MYIIQALLSFFILESLESSQFDTANFIDLYENCCSPSFEAKNLSKTCGQSFENAIGTHKSIANSNKCRDVYENCCEDNRKNILSDRGISYALSNEPLTQNTTQTFCSLEKIHEEFPLREYAEFVYRSCLVCKSGSLNIRNCTSSSNVYAEKRSFMACCERSRGLKPCGLGYVSNKKFPEFSNKECSDVNECLNKTLVDTKCINKTCINLEGGYRCVDFNCPENYYKIHEMGLCRLKPYQTPCIFNNSDQCSLMTYNTAFKELYYKYVILYTGNTKTKAPFKIYSFKINNTDPNIMIEIANVTTMVHRGFEYIVPVQKNFHVVLQTRHDPYSTQLEIVLTSSIQKIQDVTITATIEYVNNNTHVKLSKHNIYLFIV